MLLGLAALADPDDQVDQERKDQPTRNESPFRNGVLSLQALIYGRCEPSGRSGHEQYAMRHVSPLVKFIIFYGMRSYLSKRIFMV